MLAIAALCSIARAFATRVYYHLHDKMSTFHLSSSASVALSISVSSSATSVYSQHSSELRVRLTFSLRVQRLLVFLCAVSTRSPYADAGPDNSESESEPLSATSRMSFAPHTLQRQSECSYPYTSIWLAPLPSHSDALESSPRSALCVLHFQSVHSVSQYCAAISSPDILSRAASNAL